MLALFTVAMFVNVGMWLERFVIIVTSLHRDFLPSSWEMYYADVLGLDDVLRHVGLFVTLMFLFVRVLPMISIFEMRTLLPEAKTTSRRKEARTDEPEVATPRGLRADGRVRLGPRRCSRRRGGARDAGYRHSTPSRRFPIHELAEALGFRDRRIPLLVLLGGIFGGLFGYGLQYWTQVINYPLNIGGRPLLAWPSFIPVTFEMTILFAALTAVFGMLALNGLPLPYHPVFNAPRFALRQPGPVLPAASRPATRSSTARRPGSFSRARRP